MYRKIGKIENNFLIIPAYLLAVFTHFLNPHFQEKNIPKKKLNFEIILEHASFL